MKAVLSLVQKELRSSFNSPMAYGFMAAFLVFTSVMFLIGGQFIAANSASLRGYFGLFPMVFIILIPAMTMRSWAEERKMGAMELFLTLPLRPSEMVLGKYLASVALLALMFLLTLPLTLMVVTLGSFEPGEIIGQYLGLFLLGASGLALGQFMSSLSSNQISAFLLGLAVMLFFTLSGTLAAQVDIPKIIKDVLLSLSFVPRFSAFERGILDTRDFLYFVFFAGFFLYLNTKVLIYRKWR